MVTARELIDQASAILLDFDGPVCSVFAGLPAAHVADMMRVRLGEQEPSADLRPHADDPLEVLRAASEHSASLAAAAEELLATAELEAITTAAPTQGAREFLETMRQRGTPVAIVSNNGERAIREYLERESLAELVDAVSARDPHDARLMKPNPKSLVVALALLERVPANALVIGDSVSDITAAHRAGVRIVAYANRPSKKSAFEAAHADSVITSMCELDR